MSEISLNKESVWDSIEAILVLSLDQRPERWTKFLDGAKKCIPEEKLERFSASHGISLPGYGTRPWFCGKKSDSRWAGKAGCTLSHQRMMESAKESDWKAVLILEDDADFSNTAAEEFEEVLCELLSVKTDWDVCYLGFSRTNGPSIKLGEIGKRGLYFISGAATTHAYLVKAKGRDWIREKLPAQDTIWKWTARHRILDRWFSWNMSKDLRVYAISPSIVTQMGGYSDIVGKNVDYSKKFPGRVLQSSESRISYFFGRLIWRFKGSTISLYDRLRYFFKCIRGF